MFGDAIQRANTAIFAAWGLSEALGSAWGGAVNETSPLIALKC